MDCVRVSFLRDGKEVTWFSNYDLEVIRKVIDLLGLDYSDYDLRHFVCGLSDLLYFAENGD